MHNKKLGLVLSLGAAQGLAHIGVIKVLNQNNIKFDFVTGSSMGAFIGACYAKDADIVRIERSFRDIDVTKIPGFIDPKFSILSKGLMSGKKVMDFLKSIIGDVEFKDLTIPLAVVATDVDTGEEIVFKEGSVLDAVRASISMPAIFVPVKIGNRYLIDGGSVNPLPVDIAKNMGAEYIVVSNIVPSPAKRETSRMGKKNQHRNIVAAFMRRLLGERSKKDEDMPYMFSALVQALHITEYKIVSSRLKEADLVITPDTRSIDTLDFIKAKEAIQKGEEAAYKAIEKMKGRSV
jgi:NTE family protein